MENVTDKSAVHPQVVPRIGNEYQADIPPLIAKFERLEITNKHADSEVLDLSFSLGLLPIPWKNCEAGKFKGNVESVGSSKENEISELEVKPRNAVLGDAKDVEDSQIKPWSKIEEDSFVLSLYVFGKNLTLVKRFIGSRDMGDVLCFYYGKFYSSDGYRRWSKCRKLKGNPCIQGESVYRVEAEGTVIKIVFSCVQGLRRYADGGSFFNVILHWLCSYLLAKGGKMNHGIRMHR